MPSPGNFGSDDHWSNPQTLPAHRFTCGYCGMKVSSEKGYAIIATDRGLPMGHASRIIGGVFICPNCNAATYHPPYEDRHVPSPSYGRRVKHVPSDLDSLHDEARACMSNEAFTAAVLICRKMLMHLAVQKGAKAGLSFVQYVDHLAAQGYVPPDGKPWVDHIRKKSNEANHEIVLMTQADATELLTFIEMLLTFIYEFPNRIPAPPAAPAPAPKAP